MMFSKNNTIEINRPIISRPQPREVTPFAMHVASELEALAQRLKSGDLGIEKFTLEAESHGAQRLEIITR